MKLRLLSLWLLIFSVASFAQDSGTEANLISPLELLEKNYQEIQKTPTEQTTYSEITSLWKMVAGLEHSESDKIKIREWAERKNDLLQNVGQYRYDVIEKNGLELGRKEFLEDSLFEVQIIPQRWLSLFEIKYLEIKTKLKAGSGGVWSLWPELSGLFLFLLLPLLVIRLNHILLERVEDLRNSLSNPYKMTKQRQRFSLALQRLGPFIPFAVSIFALKIFSQVIQKTILSELDLLIPFILYYLYYKIFRQLVINLLIVFSEFVKIGVKSGKSNEAKIKIFKSTKLLGRFFFITLVSLHLVSSVAGRGLLYQEMYFLFSAIGIGLYLWLVHSWSHEIDSYVKNIFLSEVYKVYEKVADIPVLSFVPRTFSFIIIILNPLYKIIKERFFDLSIGKSIVAKVFQRKLETNEQLTEHSSSELPQEYRDWFSHEKDDDVGLWVASKGQRIEEIKVEVDEWLRDTSEEHSLAIYGDKGIGKTQVLRHVEKYLLEHPEKPDVVVASVPPKLSSRSEVLKYLGKLVAGEEINDVFELLDLDKRIEKKVIILDDAHNFFLTHFGGFKGIEVFFEALNVRTDNIFWITSFNTYSWIYLSQVFSKNKYFRTVFKIKGFSDEELQDYILRRHERSGYFLSYGDIIRAVKTNNTTDEVTYVENMFFRLLWEQSHGNPELAEKLWLKALKPMFGKRLKVGLPLVKNYSLLSKLSDEPFFIYSALVRHENLTAREIIQVTDMKEGAVRHALRLGLENEFLTRSNSDRRYRFSVEGQYTVLNHLKAKNFIYE